jgi:hypothetical protein
VSRLAQLMVHQKIQTVAVVGELTPMERTLKVLSILSLGCLVGVGLSNNCRAEDPKDILWFGNSFTNATCCGSSMSVPNVVSAIATAAGHVAPRRRNSSVDGQTLEWHRTRPATMTNINSLAAGEFWENVVLQDYSTQPTHIGNLALHRSSSVAMYNLVAAHSPNVVPVMYETWARGPGHEFYSGANPLFPGGPAQMQQEVRDGYHLSTADINAAVGANVARLAPAGDAWESAGLSLNLYGPDIYHAQNRGTLLNALVLYGTIYDDRTTSDINLSGLLATLGVSANDGQWVAALADAVLGPGDFNHDGHVDGLDLAQWQTQFGQTRAGLSADGDVDGDVDGADFLNWQRHADLPGGAVATAVVTPTPEPGAVWLLAGSMSALFFNRSRGGR